MGAVVVVGAQWGDEGKGKVVDMFARSADQVVRYSGGANAGHTMVVGGEQLIFHLIPCGALHPQTECVLGQGMVVNPEVLVSEIEGLDKRGIYQPERFVVSERAHLVLPQHLLVDELREQRAGAIGTTKRGIGPAYEDKVGRRGVRVGDMLAPSKFRAKLEANLEAWTPTISTLGGKVPPAGEIFDRCMGLAERIRPIIGDAAARVAAALAKGAKVLMEGAQGTMLDIDGGTYPFVTGSSTVAGSACIGSGIGPTAISAVVGVSKAYTTRVGRGPFPTELTGKTGEQLREVGAEFGATTGRPRRCGWLDIPVLRVAARANGLTGLALTKLDVLTGHDPIHICTAYELDGQTIEVPPYDELDRVKPVYEAVPGWREPLSNSRTLDDLPANARGYVRKVEEILGCPVWVVGVGPDRDQSIVVHDPMA